VLRAGFAEVLVTGMPDPVDQGEAEADRDRREALRRAAMGCAQDHEQVIATSRTKSAASE